MPFQIIRNDITKVKADAIVNTANPEVAVGEGVDSAIYSAAGHEKLFAERMKIGYLAPGMAAVTPAFNLDAKYIIHVSGPWWEGGNKGEPELLRKCYEKVLSIAADKNCKSVAFPLMATGAYGFPKDIGMEIAVSSFTGFLEEHDMDIFLVVFGDRERVFAERNRAERISYGRRPSVRKPESLDDVIKGIYMDSFEKHLVDLILRKGLKNSEVYAAANISKQYFSKLIKGQVKPSKEKVLALAVGLRLNMIETVDFLRLAGYAFSPISQTDAVVEYFIEHGDYNVLKIDIALFDYGLDPLSNG